MNVVRLDQFRNRDTIEVLEALLRKAQLGQLRGIALCYRERDGSEEAVITGSYAASTDAAAAAALRLSMKLAGAKGEYQLSP
jgi:hypothetical protein